MTNPDDYLSESEELDESGGTFSVVVELKQVKEFRSRDDAIAYLRKMRADMERDSAFSHYEIGRESVRRVD